MARPPATAARAPMNAFSRHVRPRSRRGGSRTGRTIAVSHGACRDSSICAMTPCLETLCLKTLCHQRGASGQTAAADAHATRRCRHRSNPALYAARHRGLNADGSRTATRKGRRMGHRYQSILETVGNTPVVRVNNLAPAGVDLYVKIEAFNPLGSVKDRLALGVIEAAEKSGDLKPGQTVIEATSGNTGIGLAMVCAQKGYPLVVTMAEPFSVERRKLMRFLGAKVVITPAAERGMGMVKKAVELAETHGWFLTRQFENEANPDMHSRTTAREILADFEGEPLDYWVTGFGTGGTLKGVARVLAKERPETKIVVCEPADAPMLTSGAPQERQPDGSAVTAHTAWKPHPMQGWSPDFIPKLTGDAVDTGVIARIMRIPNGDAMR